MPTSASSKTRARCDLAEAIQDWRCDGHGLGSAVEHGVDRQRWARALAIAGYLLSAALIVWGAVTGELTLVLAGLVRLAILVLMTDG